MTGLDALEWVERLGGWGAVLIVVRWLLTRMDRLIDSFEGAIASFRAFETEERETHAAILRELQRLNYASRRSGTDPQSSGSSPAHDPARQDSA